MKIIVEPNVKVVAFTKFDGYEEKYQMPEPEAGETDAEKLGAFGAKVCYDSYGRDGRPVRENQKRIIEARHGSVLEHAHVSLFIEGITRNLSLELNRHRTLNISQRSTRYTDESECGMVLPPCYVGMFKKYQPVYSSQWDAWRSETEVSDEDRQEYFLLINYLNHLQWCVDLYADQVKSWVKLNPNNLSGVDLRKWAREQVRDVLNGSLETKAVYTNNIRGWRWIIELRSHRSAAVDIRRLVGKILLALYPLAPTYFSDFRDNGLFSGITEWCPLHSKI